MPTGVGIIGADMVPVTKSLASLLSELRGHDYTEVRCVQGGTPPGPAPWDVALVEHLPSILSHL